MPKHRYAFPDARILFFSRAPEAGKAKTRLIPRLGPEGAARLHAAMLQHVLQGALDAQLAPVALWCHPDCSHPVFRQIGHSGEVALHAQQGRDVGGRMEHALSRTLATSDCALLCGTDCPGLDAQVINRCLALLQAGSDAVMIPAEDGGYVALGLRHPVPCLFEGMEWGTAGVAESTRERLAAAGLRWSEPVRLWDVDEVADLQRLERAYPRIWEQACIRSFSFKET